MYLPMTVTIFLRHVVLLDLGCGWQQVQGIMADMPLWKLASGGVYFAMVDGSVRFLNSKTDAKILGTLANRHDAQIAELIP